MVHLIWGWINVNFEWFVGNDLVQPYCYDKNCWQIATERSETVDPLRDIGQTKFHVIVTCPFTEKRTLLYFRSQQEGHTWVWPWCCASVCQVWNSSNLQSERSSPDKVTAAHLPTHMPSRGETNKWLWGKRWITMYIMKRLTQVLIEDNQLRPSKSQTFKERL